MEIEQNLKNELGNNLQLNEPLSKYNCLGVGGVADYFYIAKTIDDLMRAVTIACKVGLPYFVLGGGNNVIPSDSGFSGLIIKNDSGNIVFNSACSEVIVDSGVSLATLINSAAGRDLGGLEFLAGERGTIGGAIKNGYGDDAFKITDFVKSVTLAVKKGNELVLTNIPAGKLDFSSKLFDIKGTEYNYPPVILTARMQLVHRRKDEILKLIMENWQRRKHQIEIEDRAIVNYFKKNIEDSLSIEHLLDGAGARKIKVGDAAVSKRYSNALVNSRNASASDIRTLAENLRDAVQKKYGIHLEERIEYFGRW